MQLRDPRCIELVADLACLPGVHQQRLPERAIAQEVEQLFQPDLVALALGEQQLRLLGAVVVGEHTADMGLAQIVQALLARARQEVAEIARRVAQLQVLVGEVVVAAVADRVDVVAHDLRQHAVLRRHVVQEIDHAAGVGQPLPGIGAAVRAQQHRIAHDFLGLPARIGVVADVGDAVRGQALACNPQDRFLHLRRYPAVDTVADDVVELAQARPEIGNARLDEAQVLQSHGGDGALSCLHLHWRQVDAGHFGMRVTRRERDHVATGGAAQLEHAGALRGGSIQAEQMRDGAQVLRGRYRERRGNVGKLVVGAADLFCKRGHVRCDSTGRGCPV